MCLIPNKQKTEELESQPEHTITLYKVYCYDREYDRLQSPHFYITHGGLINFAGNITASIRDNNIFIDDMSGHLKNLFLTDEHKTLKCLLKSQDGIAISCGGIHCLSDKESAEKYAENIRKRHSVIVEVTAKSSDVIAVGVTPSITNDESYPTVLVSKINITQEEFDKARATTRTKRSNEECVLDTTTN